MNPLTQKILDRIKDERNMHACAVGHGYDSSKPVEHKIYELGWANARSHLDPIIEKLLKLLENQRTTLEFYGKHHHHLKTTAPNFGSMSITHTDEVLRRMGHVE